MTNAGLVATSDEYVAARCTFNSTTRTTVTRTGSNEITKDEMCNFYVMYYTNATQSLSDTRCVRHNRVYSWERDEFLKSRDAPPENASDLTGVELVEPELELPEHRKT